MSRGGVSAPPALPTSILSDGTEESAFLHQADPVKPKYLNLSRTYFQGRREPWDTVAVQSNPNAEIKVLVHSLYPALRDIAGRLLRSERQGHTLQKTALVNEALLQLVGKKQLNCNEPKHLLALAATRMRRILTDYGRMRRSKKRFTHLCRVPLFEVDTRAERDEVSIVSLNQALERLGDYSPRALRVVELKWFAGCTNDETAAVLGVSDGTVETVWLHARLWLYRELTSKILPKRFDQHDV